MSGSERTPPELCLITNRHLSAGALEARVEKIMIAGASRVILREKDLPDRDLLVLARALAEVAARRARRLIINSSLEAAAETRAWGLQLPFEDFLRRRNDRRLKPFKIGVSVHSLREAQAAERLGADYLLAGHIFSTECKAGRPGRGLDFIRRLKAGMNIPLWVVGGILPGNARQAVWAGADVVCVMSTLLESPEPEKLVGAYLKSMAGSVDGADPYYTGRRK